MTSPCTDSFSKFSWRWPDPLERFSDSITFEQRQAIDSFFQELSSFFEKYQSNPIASFGYQDVQNAISHKTIFQVFCQKDSLDIEMERITLDVPPNLFYGFKKDTGKFRVFVDLKVMICDSVRTKIYLLIDLSQGLYITQKLVTRSNEIKIAEIISKNQSAAQFHHIHPIIDIIRIKKQDCYTITEYCPQGDLKSFIKSHHLSFRKRLHLCFDAICAVFFLHQLDPWEFETRLGDRIVTKKVERTAHSDIKLSNFVVKEGRAFLIDHEFVGEGGSFGTYDYFDPQKNKMWLRVKQNLQDRRKEGAFYQAHAQAQDVWALGLVLLSLMTAKEQASDRLGKDHSYDVICPAMYFSQERVDRKVKAFKKEMVFSMQESVFVMLQSVRMFQLIEKALTIDYAKRADVFWMQKMAKRIEKALTKDFGKKTDLDWTSKISQRVEKAIHPRVDEDLDLAAFFS